MDGTFYQTYYLGILPQRNKVNNKGHKGKYYNLSPYDAKKEFYHNEKKVKNKGQKDI